MNRTLTVLYGSQTGCAQEVAERVARDAKKRHFKVTISSMDAYDRNKMLHEPLIVFVCSTTGQGEEPDNMKKFWMFLRKKSLPTNVLNHLKFSVFGLGDSSYEYFNFVAKRLYRRLIQLGATPIYPRGDGDDQADSGVDEALIPWLNGFWKAVLTEFPLPPGLEIIPDDQLAKPRYKIHFSKQKELNTNDSWKKFYQNMFMARMIENRRITAKEHDQDVRHIVFDISGSNFQYNPGDVLAIQPLNLEQPVSDLLKRLSLDPKQLITIEKVDKDAPDLPFETITFHDLFTRYLDIQGTPKRYFFEVLGHFASDPIEKERLLYFGCAPDAIQELYNYNQKEKRTYVEVFEDFSSVKLPLDYLLDIIPPIQPRYFSISSSQLMTPNQVHITVAIVKFKTPYKRIRKGMCSSWLESLDPTKNDKIFVPVWIRKGTMNLPKEPTTPIIMVGPGTGFAPFRSFIQTRAFQAKTSTVGTTILFFGNRKEKMDFLYSEELKSLDKPFKVITAFSRDQDRKIYVQHRLKQHAKDVWKLISEEGAYFYVAGNAKQMPKDVRDCMKEIIEKEGKITDCDKYMKLLIAKRRYQVETWS